MLAVNSWNEVYTYAFLDKLIFECFLGLRLKMNGSGWIDSESGWVCCPWLLQRLDRWRHFSIEHVSASYKVWHSASFCISSFFVLLQNDCFSTFVVQVLHINCSGAIFQLPKRALCFIEGPVIPWSVLNSGDLASVTCVNLFCLARKLLEPHV